MSLGCETSLSWPRWVGEFQGRLCWVPAVTRLSRALPAPSWELLQPQPNPGAGGLAKATPVSLWGEHRCSGHPCQHLLSPWCYDGAQHPKQSWCEVPGEKCLALCGWVVKGSGECVDSNRFGEWKKPILSVLLGWQSAEKRLPLSLQKIV